MSRVGEAQRLVRKAHQYVRSAQRGLTLPRTIRSSDTFLVTYPKSGTTWLGFMIANVLNSSGEQLNLRTAWNMVPDINDAYFGGADLGAYAHLPDPRVFLVHAPYDPLLRRVVYVMRDPRDVMVSYYHHKRLTVQGWNMSLTDFLLEPQQWPCPWEVHVRGWLSNPPVDHLMVVRYEEMHRDASAILRRVLDFAGVAYRDGDVERAVSASGFDRMRAVEERYGVEGAKREDERFIRRGQVGGWREELQPAEQDILQAVYGDLAREYGFADVAPANTP